MSNMQTKEWNLIDKSGWSDGPWQSEPDKVQWLDESTGLPCLIVRQSNHGALCGYVGVSKGHPLFGKDYGSVDFDCHGGLTFADECSGDPDGLSICHLAPGEDDVWWLGFDCAHAWDLWPASEAHYMSTDQIYCDLTFVRRECASLAKQIQSII